MAYTYILHLKNGERYIGSTTDLSRRMEEHNDGKVQSTKFQRPLFLIGYRVFETIEEAAIFENKYKRSHGQLERDFKNGKIQYIRGVA